jgi:MFS family permease
MSPAAPIASESPPHPLRYGAFRAYLLARLSAVLAQSGMMLVIGWQTYNLARETMSPGGAAAQLGVIGLVQFAALFVMTPASGWAADAFDRRRLALAALTLELGCALGLAWLTWEGTISLPAIFLIAALLGTGRAFLGPSMGSLAPNILPPAALPRGIALGSIAWQTGTIAGPAIAGYAYAAVPWFAYALSAGLFLAAMTMLLIVGPVPQAAADRGRHPIRQVLDGIAYVRSNRLVLATITLDLFAVLLAGTTALLPVYARDILHVGAEGLGHLAAAPGVGAALTALWFSVFPMKTNVGVKMLIAVIVFGLATTLFGATAFMPRDVAGVVALGAMVVWGSADMISVFVRSTLVQLYTPDAMRGRVSSVSQLTISASNELGEAESGFLAALVGPVAAVIAGGVGAIVVTLVWARLFPELRRARTFDPPPAP